MKQFFLGKSAALKTSGLPTALTKGEFGLYKIDDATGLPVAISSVSGLSNRTKFILACGRDAGTNPYIIPLHAHHISCALLEYQAAVNKVMTFTVPEPVIINGATQVGDYSLIIAKKGVGWNERNKWTGTYHVPFFKEVDENAIAEGIATALQNNIGHGCVVTVEDNVITVTGSADTPDFELIGADLLTSVVPEESTPFTPGQGSAKYITDLANKDAADNGIEYTYRDAYYELYPEYPLNPLAQPDSEDSGFDVLTVRFAEPRDVKTRDEVVHQLIQIAAPTGAAVLTTLQGIFEDMAEL